MVDDDADPDAVTDATPAGDEIGAAGEEGSSEPHPVLPAQWSDVAAGELTHPAVPLGAEVWIVATARLGTDVWHWRQGPLVNPVLELPEAARLHPDASTRTGTVAVRIVVQQPDGTRLATWPAPRLTWTLLGSEGQVPVLRLFSDHVFPTNADGSVSADL